jgi:hypothetical protein
MNSGPSPNRSLPSQYPSIESLGTNIAGSPAEIRRRALWRLPLGLALVPLAVLMGYLHQKYRSDGSLRWAGLIGMGAVALPFLAACLELISGVPLRDLSTKWDGLAGWQRGLLGTLIITLALFFGFGILYFGSKAF